MEKNMRAILKQAQRDAGWLLQSLNEGGMGVWVWNIDTGLVEMDRVEKEFFGLAHIPGLFQVDELLAGIDPDDIDAVNHALEAAINNGVPFKADFRYKRPQGNVIWMRGRASIIKREGDPHRYLAGTNFDITNEVQSAQDKQFVAEEMAHRSKNLVTLIDGISRMTARHSDTVEDYQAALSQRLRSIDAANSFIVNEMGKDIIPSAQLVAKALHGFDNDTRLNRKISAFNFNRRAAQTMSLILNELATNAVKYGALKDQAGRVQISIDVDEAADEIEFSWDETLEGKLASVPEKSGFGTQVTLKIAKSTFSGVPSLEWRDQGLLYTCKWPASLMSTSP
jgi:two-component sensor histidine kinase